MQRRRDQMHESVLCESGCSWVRVGCGLGAGWVRVGCSLYFSPFIFGITLRFRAIAEGEAERKLLREEKRHYKKARNEIIEEIAHALAIHDEIVDTMYDKGYTSIPDTVCNVYKTNRRGTRRIKNV